MSFSLEYLYSLLDPHGLVLRGGCSIAVGEIDGVDEVSTLFLVGCLGRSLTHLFEDDVLPDSEHPLDQWSRSVLEPIAATLGGQVFFPFGGPPYFPFHRWALRCETLFPSPLGLFIHPVYGLWHHYRGALVVPGSWPLPVRSDAASPCESCSGQPCLHACPVEAYSIDGFSLGSCLGHLDSEAGASCMEQGCKARDACPVAPEAHYSLAQKRFHMRFFRRDARKMLDV